MIILTLKKRIKGKLGTFLILTGSSTIAVLASIILHNLFYALALFAQDITFLRYLAQFLEIVFFFVSILLSPVVFIIGAVSSIVLLRKKKQTE